MTSNEVHPVHHGMDFDVNSAIALLLIVYSFICVGLTVNRGTLTERKYRCYVFYVQVLPNLHNFAQTYILILHHG